ncbi:MAG: hypothetical protein QOH06_4728 [Acidobacteriota bacterium]|jgi:hypothetical protein|nr:hypothetical protein [Acidobacteriota bacterium]
MFQKKMQRAAVVLLTAALLLTAPLQAAGWTTREAPGLLETAWGWLVEWVIGGNPAEPSLRSVTATDKVPIPPAPRKDDGGAIDPNG